MYELLRVVTKTAEIYNRADNPLAWEARMYKGSHNPPRSVSTYIMWGGLLLSLSWFVGVYIGFSDVRVLIAGGIVLGIGFLGAIVEAILGK